MSIDLSAPLAWRAAPDGARAMLDQLQPNIVKPHARDAMSVLFLRFGDAAEARAFLAGLTALMKSARVHLEEVAEFKRSGTSGTPYVGVGLTASGYDLVGVPAEQRPADPVFTAGMRAGRAALADPPASEWDEAYRGRIDAVVLIGAASDAAASARRTAVQALIPDSVMVLGEETGLGMSNAAGNGIEHFGYVDGRSQPLFLTEDVEQERLTTDGTTAWDPAFPLGQVIVPDPAAPQPEVHFGSYFVFRKLEQNVRRFQQAEEDLAGKLGLTGPDAERAGALLVGRFEDGTPVTLQSAAGGHTPVMNDFTYASDPAGAKCPFSAHIRKTNPRGSGGFGQTLAQERSHLMARRGQTYGVRRDDPTADLPAEERPVGGVGLLFMAFNADLGRQFEFTQRRWANATGFPQVPEGTDPPGVDPVMGQGVRPATSWPTAWGGSEAQAADAVAEAVTMKGGEYFFMPSLAFLAALVPAASAKTG